MWQFWWIPCHANQASEVLPGWCHMHAYDKGLEDPIHSMTICANTLHLHWWVSKPASKELVTFIAANTMPLHAKILCWDKALACMPLAQ